jgi:hypothetical protein
VNHQNRPVLLVDGPLEGQWHTAPPGTSAVFSAPLDIGDPRGLKPLTDSYQIIDVQIRIGPSVYTVAAGFSRSRVAEVGMKFDLKDIEARIILHLFDQEAADVLLGGGTS